MRQGSAKRAGVNSNACERVLTLGPKAVDRYIGECKDLGFDIIEISSGFITLPDDDWLRLVEKVSEAGSRRSRRSASSSAPAARRRPTSWRRKARAIPGGRSSRHGAFSMPARTRS